MVVAKIQSIYYKESDNHTVGYSNSCKHYCKIQDSYRLFRIDFNDSDYKLFIADSEEIVRNLIREKISVDLSGIIKDFKPHDFLFRYSHCEIENNQFWIPSNLGYKYNVGTLSVC